MGDSTRASRTQARRTAVAAPTKAQISPFTKSPTLMRTSAFSSPAFALPTGFNPHACIAPAFTALVSASTSTSCPTLTPKTPRRAPMSDAKGEHRPGLASLAASLERIKAVSLGVVPRPDLLLFHGRAAYSALEMLSLPKMPALITTPAAEAPTEALAIGRVEAARTIAVKELGSSKQALAHVRRLGGVDVGDGYFRPNRDALYTGRTAV